MKVWDLPVRLLHWSLAALVIAAWSTGGSSGPLHEWLGYGAGAVVLARVVWGFAGGRYARFAQFVRGPRATLAYARAVLAGTEPHHLGHNPLGGWMVLALLGSAGALALSGALYVSDWLWGYEWLYLTHATLGWIVVALVPLHVAGVVFTGHRQRENLVRAMLTGRKPAPTDRA
ncbi:cytochrome b/b6 domain-containing protein [Derxia gummosa]|uniref:Cytochrome b/b6 domain-containing protein n=1 Tax=Derxia gummosa DSM 723 TaxID=1121388 RepID=A0A8B6X5L4_9BURK|nr:cytochrome b/b6 domain-containing protein [Derxia gummosa]